MSLVTIASYARPTEAGVRVFVRYKHQVHHHPPAARVGLGEPRRLYGLAFEQRHGFFTYGHAMFIE
jgi:hypothetical protein